MYRLKSFLENAVPYKVAVYSILQKCYDKIEYKDLEIEIKSYPVMASSVYSPQALLGIMADYGAVKCIMEENPDKTTTEYWLTTPEGTAFLTERDSNTELSDLADEDEEISAIYWDVLKYCITAKSVDEIDSKFGTLPILIKKNLTPHYFIRALERTGGLEWTGEKWRTQEQCKKRFSSKLGNV